MSSISSLHQAAMETDAPEEVRMPPRPSIPEADGSLLTAQFGAGLWLFWIVTRVMRQVIGRGQGFLSFDFSVFEAVLLVFWIGCLVGALVLAFKALGTIRESDGELPGKGEAISAIAVSSATVALTILGPIVVAVVNMMKK